MMMAEEASCAVIVDALFDDPVLRTKQQLLLTIRTGGDLDASDSLDLDWSCWSLPVNWTDDDEMTGNHLGRWVVVVR